MTLLNTDTDKKADETAGAPEGATPVEAPPATATCPTCSAPVEPGQDWCLNCGEAQASRRITLPGKRAAATVMALTTVLVGGAVAASYAALTDGTEAPGQTPTQIAQASTSTPAPAPTPDPSAAIPDASAALPSSSVPADPAPTDSGSVDDSSLPPLDSGSTDLPDDTGTDTGTSNTDSTGDTDTGDDTSSGDDEDTTADTRTSTTPEETEPVAIELADGAGALYDPFKRDSAAGEPAKAFDGDPNTSFPVTVAAGSTQIGAGLTVDLGKQRGVRQVDVTTKTPGFKIEIYATNEADLPPDVLDTRWAHLKDVTGVGSDTDGKETVSLGSGTTKYRHVLLWFTAPPTEGSTVRVSELKLLG